MEALEQRQLLAAQPFAAVFDPAPLMFLECAPGPRDTGVAFLSRGGDLQISLLQDCAVFRFDRPASEGARLAPLLGPPPAADSVQVSMTWQGGNEASTVIGLEGLPARTNYAALVSPESSAGMASFERVRYSGAYDGIDLEFYSRDGEFEFDWIVAPGVAPSQITMVYAGMDSLALDADGNLVLSAGDQQLIQHAPVTYQIIAGVQREVASSYQLGAAGEVRFALGDYDPSLPLVIDPVLTNSTYLGGSNNDYANDIATDSQGNTYVIGTSASHDLPGGGGPDNGINRAFIKKYLPDGTLDEEFFTYPAEELSKLDASGFAESFGLQVVIGPDDLPLVAFETFETETFDLGNGILLPFPGTHYLHFAKLSEVGLTLIDTIAPVPDLPGHFAPLGFSGVHLATDDEGAIYATYSAARQVGGGNVVNDTFLTKVAPDGSVAFTLQLGDVASAIAVDFLHNIYFALSTSTTNRPVTAGALQTSKLPVMPPGTENLTTDVWLGVVDPTGTNLIAATYLGGSRYDYVSALAVDRNRPGQVFLVGYTESSDFPTKNPFQLRPANGPAFGSEYEINAFVTLIDVNVTPEHPQMTLEAATYFGGGRGDYFDDIALDAAGNVYVVGSTNSLNLPVANPLQATWTEGALFHQLGAAIFARDLLVAKFDPTLASLEFSTYLGGKGHDSGASLAVDANGTIHVAATSSGRILNSDGQFIATADFPIVNAQQPVWHGGPAGFVTLTTDAVVLTIVQRGTVVGRGAQAVEGQPFQGIVADFTSPRVNATAGEFTAKIEWGDGDETENATVVASSTPGHFFVTGSHQYNKIGAYPVTVRVVDNTGAMESDRSPASNINVSRAAKNQIGGAIAIDLTNPLRLVAVAMDETGESKAKQSDGGTGGILLSTSKDGGATWSPRLVGTGTDGLPPALADPDVTFDRFGNLFVTYVSAEGNSIVVAWSTDGGATFSPSNAQQLSVPGSTPLGPNAPSVFTPKLAASVDNEIWVAFQAVGIMAAGAEVFGLGDVRVFKPLQPIPGSDPGFFSDIVVGPKGEVLVVWESPATGDLGRRRLLASTDSDGVGPGTFSSSSVIVVSNSVTRNTVPAQPLSDVPLGPRLASEPTEALFGGRMFVTYSDLDPDDPSGETLSVYLVYSDDRGFTWSEPTKVRDHDIGSQQFSPGIAVDPTNGNLAVTWYGANGKLTSHFVNISADGGQTFSPSVTLSERVSDAVSDPELTEYGKKHAYGPSPKPAFFHSKLYPIWSDNNRDLLDGNLSSPQFDVVTSVVGVIDVDYAPAAIRPRPIEAIKGQPFDGIVATFSHPNLELTADDFIATIGWGDDPQFNETLGTISQPDGAGTPFVITGAHTYAEAGSYLVQVRVGDKRTARQTTAISDVNTQQGSQGSPTIAIDPTNPNRVFAAWVDVADLLPHGLLGATSNDGGVTWTVRAIADGSNDLPLGGTSPRAVFDQYGNLFLTYVGLGADAQVVVLASLDGGRTFSKLRTFGDATAVHPQIAVGPGLDGADGSVWVTWLQGSVPNYTVLAAGAPVTGLSRVESFAEQTLTSTVGDGLGRGFGDITVGLNGQVIVSFLKGVSGGGAAGPAQIIVQLDPDGLGTEPFGPEVLVADTQIGPKSPIPAQPAQGIRGNASLAWDRSDGQYRSRVYLVYTDAAFIGDPNTDVFLRYSDDSGATWSAEHPIDIDPGSAFLPSVAVDQASGNVAIAWYATSENSETSTRLFVTMSDDGSETFRLAILVSAGDSDATYSSIDAGGQLLQYGRYMGLAFDQGILQPVFTQNSAELLGNPDRPNFDIAAARVGIAEALLAPLVVESLDVEEVEGNEFTRQVATFTDPNGGLLDDFTATIDWGDGSSWSDGEIIADVDGGFSVSGTHEYEKLGHYTVTVTIKGKRTKGVGTATAVIENAPLEVTIPPDLRVIRELEFTKVVATFMDPNRHSKASDFIVTIEWGDDGGASIAELQLQPGSGQNGAPNVFNVTGTHTFLTEGVQSIHVSVLDKLSSMVFAQSGDLVSGDPPLEVNEFFLDIEALQGINTGDLVLVTFERADDVEVPLNTHVGAYIATINWGDGQVDDNVIPFVTSEDVTVVGRHTYLAPGEYYPTITLRDDSGGVFYAPLIAIVEPDVTSQIRARKPGLTYNPASDRWVGELLITNTSTEEIAGPLFIVIRGLPQGVTLDSFTAVDGMGNPLMKVDQSRLSAGASLPLISLEFSNPDRVIFDYTVQVFDGLRASTASGAGLVFEPNRGQANGAVSYLVLGSNYAIGLAANQASLVLRGDSSSAGAAALMEMVGGNSSAMAVPLDPLPGVSNYLSSEQHITSVPHYARLRYTSVYNGIDLEYYGHEGALEYDWIVRPGGDVSAIVMRFHGVETILVDSGGNLRLQLDSGELVQRAPIAYQFVDGQRHNVAARFVLQMDGTVTFDVGDYDPTVPLVIDPVLIYSTYFGGVPFGDEARAVAVDEEGNSYITGLTLSTNFPTVNPFDDDLNEPATTQFFISYDAFVSKFDPNGVPIFSTYLGGGSNSFDSFGTLGFAIAVDDAGHVFVGGNTDSPLFPTLNPAPAPFASINSVFGTFLTELSADGSAILYSTVIKGATNKILDLAVDDQGAVYTTGLGVAFKLDPATNTIPYVYYVDGIGRGIAVDDFGQAYVTGFTDSSTFPTKNALFPELQNLPDREDLGDAFVLKLSATGHVLFSTYYGGIASDSGNDIAVDEFGVIYVVGTTSSNNLPVPGGLDTSLGGAVDGFLIKLANDGSSLLYGTYIGGSGSDEITGVGVDSQGRVYFGGKTTSIDLPTVRAHQPEFGGSEFINDSPGDGFAASIAADGAAFEYLTYLGGSRFDEVRGVAVDRFGNATYVGRTVSQDFPTQNAWQRQLATGASGYSNAILVRLLAGDAGTATLHNAPFTTVEGTSYNGLVAFFSTGGTETVDQFSATIDWGDGFSSAGTIAGDFRNGFQILGNHLYADVGAHDVFVSLRDSLGRTVTAQSTGTVAPGADGRVRYHVALNTASLAGTQGLLSFQFNPGAIPGAPDVEARISALNLFGGLSGASTVDGDASLISSSELTLRPSAVLNRLMAQVTLGTRIEFDLELTGPGLSLPALGNITDVFAVQLLNTDGITPLLGGDSSASLLRVNVLPDGSTRVQSSGTAVTIAASGRATVKNAPLTLALERINIQEGMEFNGPVAPFTNGNPFETVGEFTAQIDWGDGSPLTAGIISGTSGSFTVSGAHVYQHAGSYSLVVKVTEPDGVEVESGTGRTILAAETFKNNLSSSDVAPVSGDFNGDGILDLAVGPYLAVPTAAANAGVGILLGRGDGSFELAEVRTTGSKVIQLAVADFNHDGKLDVAAAISTFGETVVELLLGNGDGTLQPSIKLTDLKNPGNIVAADFNHDGHIDLAYTQSTSPAQNTRSDALKIALGRGDGTFETPISTTIPFGVQSVYAADIDEDGVPDVILASTSIQSTTTLSYLRSLGDGSFAAAISFASGLPFTKSLAIHDFDGDGQRDVAAFVGTNLFVYSGHGDGTFNAPLSLVVGSGGVVAAGDFNGDGRIDLATTGTNSVSVFLNDGVGGFLDRVQYDGVSNVAVLLAADFDRDGHFDLATSGTTSVISVIPGFGDGTFAAAVRYSSGLIVPQFSTAPEGVVTADVNGDSYLDAVLLFNNGPIVTQLGNGDGAFQSVVSSGPVASLSSGNVGMGFGGFRSPVLADFNNDGLLDLVAPNGSGIGIVFGQGDSSFPTSHVASPGTSVATILADFNQDGRLDVVGAFNSFPNPVVSVSLANADGSFQARVFYNSGSGRLIVEDVNGDSRPDVIRVGLGSISVLLGNADGTFAPLLTTVVGTPPFNTDNSPESAKLGDFNGDGKLDIVQLGFSATGLVHPGNGNGTFGAAISFSTAELNGGRDIAVGDFNADGKLDIVTASTSHVNFFIPGGGLGVLLGNGDFTFRAAVNYSEGTDPIAVTLGDFNHDGRLDIAAANFNNGITTSGFVGILFGNADGTFQAAVNYPTTGRNPRAITSGDLNGDGNLDLAVVNSSNDTAILLGNANGTFQPAVNYFTRGDGLLSGPIAVAIGDLNGDGRADLVASETLMLGNGDGTFPNRRLFTYLPSEVREVAAGDLNGDGNMDLVVARQGTTTILFGRGNGSFFPPVQLTPPVAAGIGNGSNRVALVDMDGDGDLDLVTLHATLSQTGGAVAVWRNNGNGTFSTPSVRNVPFPFYDSSLVTGPDLEFGDLNGDGFMDVVVTDTGVNDTNIASSGGVSVLLGIGDGTLALPVRYAMPPRQSAYGIKLGDVNRDGRPELILLTSPLGFDFSRSSVALLNNKGDGSFEAARIYDFGGASAMFLATGDFNGDGAADIIVPDSASATNTFGIIFAGEGPLLVTDAPVTVLAADLNPRAGVAFTATVATFTDDNPFGQAGDFTATITWGDGQTTAGTVRVGPFGGFEVIGSHTYVSNGVFSTKVTVRETGQGTHVGNATGRVNAIDQALTASGVVFNATEDLPFTGVVATFTDADPNGSLGDFSATVDWGDGQASAGSIALLAGGGFQVTGAHTYATQGTLPVRVDILDIGGSQATANSTAQIAAHVNQAPIARNDTYAIDEDMSLTVLAPQGVLANDTDADMDLLSVEVVVAPAHGRLDLAPNGSFSYTPDADFNGTDHFTYQAQDGSANSNVATVTINVRAVNDAPDASSDSLDTNEDSPITFNPLANDVDRDGTINPATVEFIRLPSHGVATADAITGEITYRPFADYFGSDSLSYKVRDDQGLLSNEAVVSIMILRVNDAPRAVNNHYATSEDTALLVTAAQGVLANDTDVDGDLLTAALIDLPVHGALTFHVDGSFTYVPVANYFGIDSFSYRVFDGTSLSAPATVSLIVLAVNDALLVAPLADRVVDEGARFTNTSSFSDLDPGDEWTATVDYGDGTSIQTLELIGNTFALDHAYRESGEFFTTVTVTDQSGSAAAATFKVTVRNVAATVEAGADQTASEGMRFNLVASFADPGILDTHTAVIDWGDGTPLQSVAVQEGSGAGTVFSSHIYADDNIYLVTVTVTDDEGAVGSDSMLVTVANVAPRVEAGQNRTIMVGESVALPALFTFTMDVAASTFALRTLESLAGSFFDPGSRDSHTATIDWGDGTVGSVSLEERALGQPGEPAGISGAVIGTHVYTRGGHFTVVLTVTDNHGDASSDSFLVLVNSVVAPDRGSISGTVYFDVAGDGLTQDDVPLPGVPIFIDTNGNCMWDADEPRTTSADDGRYVFTDLEAGSYQVRQMTPAGYVPEFPTIADFYLVTLTAGQTSSGNDFANSLFDVTRISFHDDFNRSDSTDLSGPWAEQLGDHLIADNHLVRARKTETVAVLAGVSVVDVSVSIDVDLRFAEDQWSVGLLARYSGPGDTNAYMARLYRSASGFAAQIWRNIEGDYQPLASVPVDRGIGTLRFDVIGMSLRLFFNGELVATAVDCEITTPGSVGIRQTGGTADNFSAALGLPPLTPQVTLPFADDFNRADNSLFGPFWTERSGDTGVRNNAASMYASATSVVTLNGVHEADVSVSAYVDITNVQAGFSSGLLARYSGPGDTNTYMARLFRSVSGNFAVQIWKHVGGQYTPLRSVGVSKGDGNLRFDVIGDQLLLFFDGVLEASVIDTSITGPGLVGMRLGGGTIDNFVAAEATPALASDAELPFFDGFARANSSLLGEFWTERAGDLGVQGQKLVLMAGQRSVATLNDVSESDIEVSASVDITSGGNAGLLARYTGPGDSNAYLGLLQPGEGGTFAAQIWKNTGADWENLTHSVVGSGVGELRFRLEGTQLQLFFNDILVSDTNDSSITGPGTVGVRQGGGTIDDYAAALPSAALADFTTDGLFQSDDEWALDVLLSRLLEWNP